VGKLFRGWLTGLRKIKGNAIDIHEQFHYI
jgi:hypothetical protein